MIKKTNLKLKLKLNFGKLIKKSKENGFTLIELVIALMLLTFLSVFTAQSIQKALQNKRKIQGDIDRSARLKGTLQVMERDIHLALNHRDLGVELHNLAANLAPSAAAGTTAPPTTTPPPVVGGTTGGGTSAPPAPTANPNFKPKTEVLLTQFVGEGEKLDFAVKSLVRMDMDATTADIGEVGYYLKNCRSRLDPSKSSNCLWRRVSTIIDTDPIKGGSEMVLLEDVKELKFRYLGTLKPEEWQTVWDSSPNGPAEMRGMLPSAVEITLEVVEKIQDHDKSLRMTTVASIHNPNNLEKKNDQTSTQTTPK